MFICIVFLDFSTLFSKSFQSISQIYPAQLAIKFKIKLYFTGILLIINFICIIKNKHVIIIIFHLKLLGFDIYATNANKRQYLITNVV